MSKKQINQLLRLYIKYRKAKGKPQVMRLFRAMMPEIIFRTTKLEGESVTRRMISSLFR